MRGSRWVRRATAGRVAAWVSLGLAAAVGGIGGCAPPAAPPAMPMATVGVAESTRMTIPVEANPNGTTRALEMVTIQARVRGFLTERHFAEGAMVKKGQLLLVIDEEPYKIALRAALARRDEANSALHKAEESKAREVAASQLDLDQAQLLLAQIQERRNRTLVSRHAGSTEDLDKADADRKRWESQVEADRAHLAQSKADYAVGIAAGQAQVAAAEAAVRDAELDLGYCRMTAPIDGRIGEARVKVGNLVGPDAAGGGGYTELATIQQLDPIGVDLRLSSSDLERTTDLMGAGLAVHLVRPSPSGPKEHPFEGRGYFIDNTIDETTSTFLVKAAVPNPGNKLLPGEYVKVRMVVERLDNVVVVPAVAVVETDAGTVVHVVGPKGVVDARPVVAGQAYRGMRVINQGLDAGTPVVVEGLQSVRPGMAVKAEPAALARREPVATRVTATEPAPPPRS